MSRITNIIRTSNNYFKISKFSNIRLSYTTDNNRKQKTHLDSIQSNLVKTNFDVTNNDNKLKEYITRIYKYSSVGFATSLSTSLIASVSLSTLTVTSSSDMLYPLGALYIGNVALGFYSIYKMGKINSITKNDMSEEIPEDKKMYYKIFSVSNGITLTPLVLMSFAIEPLIFPIALTATLATFGGATYYALRQTNLDAIKWQAPLMGCVVGLIGTNIMTLIASLCGFTNFANTIDFGATIVSTGVFTGLIVADTQMAINDYKEKTLDTIKTSTELLLDATNLFIDIVKILIKLKKE